MILSLIRKLLAKKTVKTGRYHLRFSSGLIDEKTFRKKIRKALPLISKDDLDILVSHFKDRPLNVNPRVNIRLSDKDVNRLMKTFKKQWPGFQLSFREKVYLDPADYEKKENHPACRAPCCEQMYSNFRGLSPQDYGIPELN